MLKIWMIIILGLIFMGCEQKTSEIETKVTAIQVEKQCPVCSKGTMVISSGIVLTAYPAQYPHVCTECGHSQHYSGIQYPYIKYKE